MKNPIKPSLKTEIFPIALLIISLVAGFFFYQKFPDKTIVHWNFAGEADGWAPKFFASFIIPLEMSLMYLFLLFMPMMDPKKERYTEFKKTYHLLKNYFVLFFTLIFFASSLVNLSYNINIGLVVTVGVGLLFMMIGNYMSKIKTNWFMGIRTPWTLSSEEVWNKTHRFGGKIFMLAGLLMMFITFLPELLLLPTFIFIVVGITLGTFIYSYVIYLKEQKKIKK